MVTKVALSYCNFASEERDLYQAMSGPTEVSLFTESNTKKAKIYFIKELLDKLVTKNIVNMPDTQKKTKIIWSLLHGLVTINFICRIEDKDNIITSKA